MNARSRLPSETDQDAKARRKRLLDRQVAMVDELARMELEIAAMIAAERLRVKGFTAT